MNERQKMVIAFFIVLYFFSIMAIIIRYFEKRNNKYYKGKPFWDIIRYQYDGGLIDNENWFNIPICAFLFISSIIVLVLGSVLIASLL